MRRLLFVGLVISVYFVPARADEPGLTLAREKNWLIVRGPQIPAGEIRINYLEAYCRPGSTDRDWNETVIKHKSELISVSSDQKEIKIRDTLSDGVIVDHLIRAGRDEVDFKVEAFNPTDKVSQAHWAQPCVRLGDFAGSTSDLRKGDPSDYISKGFIFVEGNLRRLPVEPWATKARYTPGQVWRPRDVPADDVNPRPVSTIVPSCGLIACYSKDEKLIWATAWEPYQELFQGVARCFHSDFRIGGLNPGQRKQIRGKMYIVPADIQASSSDMRPIFRSRYGRNEHRPVRDRLAGFGMLGRLSLDAVFLPVPPALDCRRPGQSWPCVACFSRHSCLGPGTGL
jgi:hypothetical protein